VWKLRKYDFGSLGRIRDLREDSDKTQREISRQLNISQRAYSYYERGQRMIPLDVLASLADLYGVSVDYLLEKTDKRAPYPPKKK
jgi:transcriptional regulator with XRE-family HTH domain